MFEQTYMFTPENAKEEWQVLKEKCEAKESICVALQNGGSKLVVVFFFFHFFGGITVVVQGSSILYQLFIYCKTYPCVSVLSHRLFSVSIHLPLL